MHASLAISILLLALTVPAWCDTREGAVETAIQQLGDDEFVVRQRATDYLWGIGEVAAPALRDAAQSRDPEVRLRARSILDRHSYGIFAGTPEHEVKLINQFRYGNETDRRKAYQQLAKEGSVGTMLALLKRAGEGKLRFEFRELVLKRLEDERQVDQLLALAHRWRGEATTDSHRERIEASMRRQVPRLMAVGRDDQAESILRDAATADAGMRDWGVYLALQDKLDPRLKVAKDVGDTLSQSELRQQMHFWRIKGDLKEPEQFARKLDASSQDALRGILFERRDWAALAEMVLKSDAYASGEEIEPLGYAAAFCRLAGRDADLEQAVEKIQRLSQKRTAMEWNCAEALLINHRIDAGIDVLRRRWPAIAFEMLCIQERYEEAFRLAKIDDPSGDNSDWFKEIAAKAVGRTQSVTRQFELAVQVARALHQLGEVQQAREAFEILTKAVQHERGSSRLHKICEAQHRAGLWELACRNAALIQRKGKYPDPLPTLFPRSKDLAQVWLEFFRDGRSATGANALLNTGELLNSRSAKTRQQMTELASKAAAYAEKFDDKTRAKWLLAIARTCELQNRQDLAVDYLEIAAPLSSDAARRLGDRAAGEEDWSRAAAHFKLARDLDSDSSISRYMHGYSLKKLGDHEAGQREIDLACLLPLAQSGARRLLASGLKQRGLRDEAMEQWRLVMRSGAFLVSLKSDFSDTSLIDAVQNVGNSLKYPLGRANYWEIMHLSCLERPLWIPSYRGYFHTPHILHKTRAQAWLRDGLIEEALHEIQLSQKFMPGNIELAEHLVPELEEAGHHAAADKLFDESFDFVMKITDQFPNSPLHHNNLAWLCARCDRELDTALAHVQRALELSPDSASYLDTLGEVHFRRGEIEESIECARRCLEIEPDNEFFRKQLERFQQARDAG